MTQDEKIEPKFKVGDWVVDKNGIVRQILSYKDGIYKHTDGYSAEIFEDEWRMWTIKDAKDGDVLATDDGNIFVFDGTVEDGKYPFAYYGLTRRRFESYDRRLPFTHNNIHPATKEQRDQLEKAMADAGYTFDFEKKELRKIEQKFAEWSEMEEKKMTVRELIQLLLEQPLDDIVCDAWGRNFKGIAPVSMGQMLNHTYLDVEE